MSVTIKDTDHGYSNLVSVLSRGGMKLKVGIFPDGEGAKIYDSGATVADVGFWAEEGTKNQPPRRWFSGWFRGNKDLLAFWIKGEMRRVIMDKQTTEEALNRIGKKVVGGIQKGILQGVPPPNAPLTVKRKGHGHMLIETGKFIQAIAYRILRRA